MQAHLLRSFGAKAASLSIGVVESREHFRGQDSICCPGRLKLSTSGPSFHSMAEFRNRREAGQLLAKALLEHLADRRESGGAESECEGGVVLALPRGGVPVGFELAKALRLPLDVLVVRKLGVPGHPELAAGALSFGGEPLWNQRVIAALQLPARELQCVVERERRELIRQEQEYRGTRPWPNLAGRWVLVADDGLATGSTMKAALSAIRQREPAQLVVAVPVGARQSCRELESFADEVLCLSMPEHFLAVGASFQDFAPVGDEEVRELLEQARALNFPRRRESPQAESSQPEPLQPES